MDNKNDQAIDKEIVGQLSANTEIIWWKIDFIDRTVVIKSSKQTLLGYSKELIPVTVDQLREILHPDDIPVVNKVFQDNARENIPSFDFKARFRNSNNKYTWLYCKGTLATAGTTKDESVFSGICIELDDKWYLTNSAAISKTENVFIHTDIPIGIYRTKLNGEILFVNKALVDLLDYKSESDLLNHKSTDFYTKLADRELWITEMLQNKSITSFEYKLLKANGEEIWVKDTGAGFFDDSGNLLYIEGIIENITEIKLAQKALKESEEKFRNIFEQNVDALVLLENNLIVDCNNSALALFNYQSKEDMIGLYPNDISPEYQDDQMSSDIKSRQMITKAFEKGSHRFEWIHKKSDGQAFFAEVLLTAVNYGNRRLMYSVVRDISDRKEIEKALLQSEEKFRTLFEHSVECLLLLEDRRIIDCNPSTLKLLGYDDKNDLIGKYPSELSPKYQPDGLLSIKKGAKMVELAFANGSHRFEWIKQHKNGSLIPVEVIITPMQIGQRTLMYGVWRDITDWKKTEHALIYRESILSSVARSLQKLLSSGDIENSIQDALQYLGEALQVDRGYVFENYWENSQLFTGLKYEWCAENIPPQLENLDLVNIPFNLFDDGINQNLSKGTPFQSNVSDLPKEMKLAINGSQVKSFLIIPIMIHSSFWGFLGFDTVKAEKSWDLSEVEVLKATATSIGFAIERKRAEEALRLSESRFRSLIRSIDDVVFEINKDYRFTGIFGEGLVKSGYTEDQFVGKTFEDVLGIQPARKHLDACQQVFSGNSIQYEWSAIDKNGKSRYYLNKLSPLRSSSGEISGIVGIGRDITIQRESDMLLRKRVEAIEFILDTATDFVKMDVTRLDEAIGNLLKRLSEFANSERGFVYMLSGNTATLSHEWCCLNGKNEFKLQKLINVSDFDFLLEKLRSGNYVNTSVTDIPRLADTKQIHNLYQKQGIKSLILIPLFINEKMKGWIGFHSLTEDKRWDYDIVNILRISAQLVASAIERKQKALELTLSEARYKEVVADLVEMLCRYSPDGSVNFANNAFSSFFRKSPDEIIGLNILDHFPDDVRILYDEKIMQLSEQQPIFELEYKINIHGSVYCFYWLFRAIYSEGTIKEYQAVGFDVTQRKKDDEQIHFLSSITENVSDSIVATDLNFNVIYINKAVEKLYGYTSDELIGKHYSVLWTNDESYSLFHIIADVLKTQDSWEGVMQNIQKNGLQFTCKVKITPVKNQEGEIISYVGIQHDITDFVKREEEVQQARLKAEESDRMKSVFLTNMSHELRTPLNGIMGFSNILFSEVKDPVYSEMLENIVHSGKRLLNTFESILDYTELEANRIIPSLEPVDPERIIRDCIFTYKSSADEKSLYIISDLQDVVNNVLADKTLLQKVLSQLVDNAVKYTHNGGIIIRTRFLTHDVIPMISIDVADTGIGIDENNFELIYKDFRQVSEGNTRFYQGSGLGLTLAKRFTELMNGKLLLKSSMGKGSVFSIILPLADENDPINTSDLRKDETTTPSLKKRVLIVEDDFINQEYTKYCLKDDYITEVVTDGYQVLDEILSKRFDIILLDINLGQDITGLDVLLQIKTIPEYKDVPVIAVTANVMHVQREEYLSSGCSHFLAKPYSRQDLLTLLKTL